MSKVVAQITTSLDGYISGPDDGPGRGLGTGGERLHYWVFGGPWTYDEEPTGEATGVDKELLDESIANVGAVIGGRATYEAAEAWGGNPARRIAINCRPPSIRVFSRPGPRPRGRTASPSSRRRPRRQIPE
jgi:hypothetical protein